MLSQMWFVAIQKVISNCMKNSHHLYIIRQTELEFQHLILKHIWATTWENRIFAYAKTKTQISFAVTAKLISAFVFATRIVQSLSLLNTKFQASSHFLRRRSLICVGPGRKPRRPVFWRHGSYDQFNMVYVSHLCALQLSSRQCYMVGAIRTTVMLIRFIVCTTVMQIMPLIGTTVMWIRILIGTTGIWAASWENQQSAYAKTKTQISFTVTAKLISAFVFASWIAQYLYFLNTKFQASSHLK